MAYTPMGSQYFPAENGAWMGTFDPDMLIRTAGFGQERLFVSQTR